MRKNISKWLMAVVFVTTVGGTALSVSLNSSNVSAASTIKTLQDCKDRSKFLTFPTWFRGLVEVKNGDCQIVSADKVGGVGPFIWVVVLNVIEIALNAVGYIAVGYMIYGGFLLMVGRGEPENIVKARLTIRDAIVGLVISVGSIAIVNLIINFGILK